MRGPGRGLEEGLQIRVGLGRCLGASADACEDSLEHGAHVEAAAALNTARLVCGGCGRGCGLGRQFLEDLGVEVRGVRHGGRVPAFAIRC